MEYEIKGVPLPVVICYLKKGDVMLSDSGAMAWMDPCLSLIHILTLTKEKGGIYFAAIEAKVEDQIAVVGEIMCAVGD